MERDKETTGRLVISRPVGSAVWIGSTLIRVTKTDGECASIAITGKMGFDVTVGEALVRVMSAKGNVVKLAIEAPRHIPIRREELEKTNANH